MDVDGVIHTTFLSLEVRWYRSGEVAVTRGKEALRHPRVSPSSERSDDGCDVTVRLTEGDAMIAVPGITDCLLNAFRHSSPQVKWRFGWECLPLAMHSSVGCAVVLPPACNVYSEAIDPQFCGVCRCASSRLQCLFRGDRSTVLRGVPLCFLPLAMFIQRR